MKNFKDRILSLLPKGEKDWTILVWIVVIIVVWILDLIIPDPLPVVDEVVLPMISAALADWYVRRKKK